MDTLRFISKYSKVSLSPVGPIPFPIPAYGHSIHKAMALLSQVNKDNRSLGSISKICKDCIESFFRVLAGS